MIRGHKFQTMKKIGNNSVEYSRTEIQDGLQSLWYFSTQEEGHMFRFS